jgi:hypothetical protein
MNRFILFPRLVALARALAATRPFLASHCRKNPIDIPRKVKATIVCVTNVTFVDTLFLGNVLFNFPPHGRVPMIFNGIVRTKGNICIEREKK